MITNIAAAERVFDVLDTEPEISDKTGVTELPPIKGAVEFKDVSFAYEDKVKVLKDVLLYMRFYIYRKDYVIKYQMKQLIRNSYVKKYMQEKIQPHYFKMP